MRNEPDYWTGYLAGVIDGEGSLCLRKHKNRCAGRGYAWDIGLVICNTDLAFLENIQNMFGGIIVPIKPSNQRWGRRQMYQLYFNKSDVKMILNEVELVLKSEQQGLILKALDILKGRGWHLSDAEHVFMEGIYTDYCKLKNKRKIGDAGFENE